jgi:hypothetical protein
VANGQAKETVKDEEFERSHRCFPPSFCQLAKQLQRRKYLEIDQSETRMACGGHVY